MKGNKTVVPIKVTETMINTIYECDESEKEIIKIKYAIKYIEITSRTDTHIQTKKYEIIKDDYEKVIASLDNK